jgi:hypothetical protein
MKTSMEHWMNDSDEEKRKCPDKNPSQCHFAHHNLTRTELESNPGLRCEVPSTCNLSQEFNLH